MNQSTFLSLVQKDLQNEWTHLQYYLHHASLVAGLHALEYKEFLTDAAKGEMEHVQAFIDRLVGRGQQPDLPAPHPFTHSTDPIKIIRGAIELENEVVKNYTERLEQLASFTEPNSETFVAYFTIFFEDQLQDSYEDCEKLRNLLR